MPVDDRLKRDLIRGGFVFARSLGSCIWVHLGACGCIWVHAGACGCMPYHPRCAERPRGGFVLRIRFSWSKLEQTGANWSILEHFGAPTPVADDGGFVLSKSCSAGV